MPFRRNRYVGPVGSWRRWEPEPNRDDGDAGDGEEMNEEEYDRIRDVVNEQPPDEPYSDAEIADLMTDVYGDDGDRIPF